MASEFADTVDVFRDDNFRQNVVDSVKRLIFQSKSAVVDSDTTIFSPGILANVVNGSQGLMIKGKFVDRDTGADLTNGLYQFSHGIAGIYRSAAKELNKAQADLCNNPGKVFSHSLLVNKSEREIELDGDLYGFRPWKNELDTTIVAGTSLPTLWNESNIDKDGVKTTANAGTITASAAGNTIVGAGTAFTAEMVGGYITYAAASYFIDSVTDATHLTVIKAADAAGGTAYVITYKTAVPSLNSQFVKGSAKGVSNGNPSAEAWYYLPFKHIFGSLKTNKLLPFAEETYTLQKQDNWQRAIIKKGTNAANARFKVTDQYYTCEVIKPKDSIQIAMLEKFKNGAQFPFRQKRIGVQILTQTSQNANVDLQINGVRVLDLWVMPQRQTYYEQSQDKFQLASGETDDWTHAALYSGQIAFPRFRAYQGVTNGYIPEYADFRNSCDLMESEGGEFITKDRWLSMYPWLYFDLSERSSEETMALDGALRLEINWASSEARNYICIYTYEVQDSFSVTDQVMQKESTYAL